MSANFSFLEFFAGGGMTRLGLGDSWRCLLANDVDSRKCAAYRENFGEKDLIEDDIANISVNDLPKTTPDLMWGSFPCQDLSLAGARGGINAKRSSAFFGFWRIAEMLAGTQRAPRIIAIENVTGLLTSNGGRDFATVVSLISKAGYNVSAMILDAKSFTPQSRPRLFIFGFDASTAPAFATTLPENETAPLTLQKAVTILPKKLQRRWQWLQTPAPRGRNIEFSNIVERNDADWREDSYTQRLLGMMSASQRQRLNELIAGKKSIAGAAFRRTRIEDGESKQRLEARFDGLAGCLRTPAGGSSRQIVVSVDKGKVRSRLLNSREAARLMGLPEEYRLPENETDALKLCGDGVCVPAIRWLAETVFEPALSVSAKKAA